LLPIALPRVVFRIIFSVFFPPGADGSERSHD
jgi:hypothetical protein